MPEKTPAIVELLTRCLRSLYALTGAVTKPDVIETCKSNDVDPLGYLTDVLARIVNGHSNRNIDQLLPWAYRKQDLKAVA